MDRRNRFEDGELTRYGAGESWRPFPRGERSPRRARSPPREREWERERERDRDRVRERDRPRSPPMVSDSYIPNRSPPRRRSRSGDRFRTDRSRGADTWRRRERSRTPPRRSSPRRSPSIRRTPIGRSPALRDDRPERLRSPPRRDRERIFDRRDDRRRSRSPPGRDRIFPGRSPMRRSPPPRAGFRPRSRSMSRRGGERFQPPVYRRPSPPRNSGLTSAIASQSVSGRSSPHMQPAKPRSRHQSRELSPGAPIRRSTSIAPREVPKAIPEEMSVPATRSPPRGPTTISRPPPSGPSATRNFTAPAAAPTVHPSRQALTSNAPPRTDVTSPTNPPSGPRGYIAPARGGGGGFVTRGSRGSWSSGPPRHTPVTANAQQSAGLTSNSIPTGPRSSSVSSGPTTPSLASKPFNPPTGPASQHPASTRITLAQSLLASLPPIIPGGKVDPVLLPTSLGVTRDIEPHYRKLKGEEERLRAELEVKQDRLRQSLYMWDKLELESKAWKTRVDFNEQSFKGLAGEGIGSAAF